MSAESVAFARELYERFVAGDPAWVEWIDPDIEWDFSSNPLADLPSRGRGRDEMLSEVVETYFSGWIDYTSEVIEMVDCGDDVVVVLHETTRMRGSDAVVERDITHIWTVRNRKWVRWRVFPSREAALEAAGSGD
jgi:ketosteroid isomerase-like protein